MFFVLIYNSIFLRNSMSCSTFTFHVFIRLSGFFFFRNKNICMRYNGPVFTFFGCLNYYLRFLYLFCLSNGHHSFEFIRN